jgi:hypothetical protein
MEHRHRAAELRLNRWFAGNGETHLAEFARIACGMFMLGNRWHECVAHAHKQHHAKGESLHAGLLGY